MVDGGPLALTVRTVVAAVAVNGCALIKVDVVVLQGADEHFHSAGNLPLGIGVLHPQEQYAAALMGHPFGDHALHQVAQVDKTGGGGGHAGDYRTLGHLTLGKTRFHLLGRFGHIGKQKAGQSLIIHIFSSFL